MKKNYLFLLTTFVLLLFISCDNSVEPIAIYPSPQQANWGDNNINVSNGFKLTGEKDADIDAIRVLNEELKINANGVNIIIGERGDNDIKNYESLIPNQKEGYYLSTENNEIVIAGNDNSGTFYGVQTLLQLIKNDKIPEVTIIDYPTVSDRGMIEGYYGNPLSYEDRVSQFLFYGKNKMNVYIYGPKDDPFHGFSDRWREFYPEKEAEKLKSLVAEAKKNKVQFIWAVHPGNDINWTKEDSIATIEKFESVYNLGVRAFAVFFDDIGGIGTDPNRQAGYLNYLQEEFVDKKKDVAPMIICPTQYNQAWSSGDYLDILGNKLLPEIRIMWTGKSVCRMIDEETMTWINSRIKRNAYIWLNYPVTDYVIDHMLMGPFVGNSQNISSQLSGFLSNPMEYGEASKVALFSIADYAWNMEKFDAQTSWLAAMKYIMPEDYEAFKIFCENNVDIGISYHGLRMPNESAAFAKDASIFWEDFVVNKYDAIKSKKMDTHFITFIDAMAKLDTSTYNPNLIQEIKPWMQVFDIMSEKGTILLAMQKSLSKNDSITFVNKYTELKELENRQKAIRSRDFEGSIKSPNPKAANEVIAPFLAKLQGEMIKYYRDNFTYKLDEFPSFILNEGKYYIKVNGKYLSNPKDSVKPVLNPAEDDINPQRQEWILTIDPATYRYIITNAQDNRFLNENLEFSTDKFDNGWHTFIIDKQNNKYAIENIAGIRKTNWGYSENEFVRSKQKEYIFEFVPIK